jgi:hypothetical protein
MITTLAILAEQIIIQESGGDQSRDSELEQEDVILLIKQSAAQVVATQIANKQMNEDISIEHHFIHRIPGVAVTKDAGRGLYYSDLPSVPFAMPDNRGVREIYPGTNYEAPFMPVASGAISFVADSLHGEVAYTLEQGKVWYHNMKKVVPQVRMTIVALNLETIEEDDQFYLPYEMQKVVIEEVRKLLSTTLESDDVNDSNDKV